MAVDQDGLAEDLRRAMHEIAQHPVIRLIQALNPSERFVHRETSTINLLSIGHNPGNSAEASRDTHRACIGEGRHPPIEHARIKFVRLAINVEIGPWESRRHERSAKRHRAREEPVDKGVLRAPQGQSIEARGLKEGAWIDGPRMRCVEDERRSLPDRRFIDDKRGVEFGFDRSTHKKSAFRAGGVGNHPNVAFVAAPVHQQVALRVHAMFTVSPLYGINARTRVLQALSNMKILLAEDDNDMRRFLAKALQNAGYDVASFDNGLSAYNRLREEPFELLLTDIVMPEMDGIELARRATELDPDIKVMFITGFAAVALNPDSKAPKDAKVLSKPFHLRDLVNEVEKLLAA